MNLRMLTALTTRTTILLLMVAIQAAAGDNVQPLNLKLGLWEMTQTSTQTGDTPVLPADLAAKLTPEQRAKIEEQMKAKARPSKVCVTKKMLEEESGKMLDAGKVFGEDKKNCTTTIITSTSTKLDIRKRCIEQGRDISAHIVEEVLSPESIKGSSQMTGSEGSRTVNFNSIYTAKWLGPDCGNVK